MPASPVFCVNVKMNRRSLLAVTGNTVTNQTTVERVRDNHGIEWEPSKVKFKDGCLRFRIRTIRHPTRDNLPDTGTITVTLRTATVTEDVPFPNVAYVDDDGRNRFGRKERRAARWRARVTA